ncbi:MAG: glycosyltransferase family 4 protein [Aquabacterium sp.]|uniref:glycosyltransferase family 4 protein n=1 Tax=Aquabacterium sp. TaxID=1872578 RepID=UPI0025BF2105|nr:glycosyltransferase family 4 protein [Aquabacterium sp.]MBI5924581.1 glycosyltransferase family 4 protein [Aquabacterium sp.]
MKRILIFDSHPVQYKAPVYQAMQALHPDSFEVIYATDVSVRQGHVDREFGKEVAWDTPLLSGYRYRVLHNERGVPLSSPASLTGRGIFKLLRTERPAAVMLTQARYWFDHTAYLSALALRIPILIRQETQDDMYAGQRSPLKEVVRKTAYRLLYAPARHAFAFGQLNHAHLTRHGVPDQRISHARFSVPNPLSGWRDEQRWSARRALRDSMGLSDEHIVLGFFGKLIDKKNPELLFECLPHLPQAVRARLHIMVVGAGELQERVARLAADALQRHGVTCSFMGFINQSKLPDYYLAADIVALPSRRMGEAWGLVINEALQAGCGVVMSDAVGCMAEFGQLERVRVIPVGSAAGLASAIDALAPYRRNFHWASSHMQRYSSEAAAQAIQAVFKRYV